MKETDKLDRRYAKALCTEVETRFGAESAQIYHKSIETRMMALIVEGDPKLAEWKTKNATSARLLDSTLYKRAADHLMMERYAHAKAKVRLTVVEERVKLRRAKLYANSRQ